MNPNKDIFNITGQSLSRRDIVSGSPSLHKALEAMIVDDLKRLVVLCDPADKLGTGKGLVSNASGIHISQAYHASVLVCW